MRPEHAVAVRAFDYLAALTFGAASALTAWLVVPGALHFVLAMALGMVAGAVAAAPVLGLFTFLLGGFELVVMSLQIGMLAGMAGAMLGAGPAGRVALLGGLVGLLVQAVLHAADRALHGEARAETQG